MIHSLPTDNMADHLNMAGLSLKDSQHAGAQGMGNGPSTYIPPHLRSRGQKQTLKIARDNPDCSIGGPSSGPPPPGPQGPAAGPAAGPPPGVAGSAWGMRGYVSP